ncbi:MAG TPA: FIST C-terminal domain-containing protein [Methylophilaceae bacterium]
MIATGFAQGTEPHADLAHQAVADALNNAGAEIANSVLLFLTPHFSQDSLSSVRTAARTANCTQVVGCIAAEIFTEKTSALHQPAAAAMVFGGGVSLQHHAETPLSNLRLFLATPEAMGAAPLDQDIQRFGGVAESGRNAMWCNSREASHGSCEVELQGVVGNVGVSHGIKRLTAPLPVTATQGHDVVFVAGKPALQTLQQAWTYESELPLHRIIAFILGEDDEHGHYEMAALVAINEQERTVTLSQKLEPGQSLCWAVREPDQSPQYCAEMVLNLGAKMLQQPDFGLMFSSLGRSPHFDGGIDYTLEITRQRFPRMPLIGFYGNGEIAPVKGKNQLLQLSAVLGLFSQVGKAADV